VKLVVFGATGRTGSQVVGRALALGYDVVAPTRRPDAVSPRDRLVVVECDALDAAAVAAAMTNGDAIICTIGPTNNRKPGTLISDGVRNLIDGCITAGISRFVFESGMLVGDGRELSATGRLAIRMAGAFYPALKADKILAEAAITASALDWTIVRPPNLNDDPAADNYIAAPAARINPTKSISHADCATALVTAATGVQWTKRVVNVGRL
jgi:uncharacterized protein YbjT (DUF2867 family)